MRRYTTPVIRMRIRGIDLTEATIHVTFAQDAEKLTISSVDNDFSLSVAHDENGVPITKIAVPLEQTQTALFNARRKTQCQVRWIFEDGTADGTEIKDIDMLGMLEDEVISYDDE